MSPSPLSIKRCTTGGTSSRRWIVAALAVALIGFGAPTFADNGTPAKMVSALKSAAPRTTDEPAVAPASVGSSSNDDGRTTASPLAPPSNDECAGAIVIPDGPYPVVTAPLDAIDATPQGANDGTLFSCTNGTDYTVWYSFTPSATTLYTFSTCNATGATGNTVIDTVLALYSSTGGSCPAVTEIACNDSSSCATAGTDLSVFSAVLNAGQTYFIVVGDWAPGGGLTPGNSNYQIWVNKSSAPANDTCGGAVSVPLDRVVTGSTAGANDDYQSPATAACYAGIGQNPNTAAGRDVVFTFTAPAAGNYSIRQVPDLVNGAPVGQDQVIYTSSSCPANGGEVSCLAGTNRATSTAWTPTGIASNRAEEITCMPLAAGQQIYIFFDDSQSGNAGNPFAIEVTACQREVEPNDTIANATPYNSLLCGNNEGSSTLAPTAHCANGPNAGNSCVIKLGRSAAQDANSSTDCGPLNCFGGPTPGIVCTATAQCGSGGTCAATALCFTDSVCVGGPHDGASCVPVCVGGPTPGLACANSGQCGSGGACAGSGGCGVCVNGPTPGDACVSNAQCGSGGTCDAGTCSRDANEGDVDFWSLGTLAAGDKVWTGVEAVAVNDFDFRMRVTSTTETLGYDDDDATVMSGSLSSTISGAQATGGETFVRVSRSTGYTSESYRLYAVATGPIGSAQAEVGDGWDITYGWPGDGLFAPYLDNGANTGLVSGTFGVSGDSDCWQLLANEGDDIMFFGDSNPDRVAGTPGIPQFIIYDAAGAAISNFVLGTGAIRNTGPFTGNTGFLAETPSMTSFFLHWRARYTGAFELCAYPYAGTLPAAGPYPKPYAGSITVNCQPPHAAGPGTTTTDVSVTKTGPVGTLATSSFFDYVITVHNNGTEIAQGVELFDALPAEVSFLSLNIDDNLGGNNTACLSLPTPGTADAPIDCTNISMAPGSTTTYTVSVQLNNCIGGGLTVENTASILTVSTDPDPSNDSATQTFQTTGNTSCVDLLCDAGGCVESLCTVNDHCDGAVCVSDPKDCDDHSVCTEDSCQIQTGDCLHDPTAGNQCDDGNPCTLDLCDPVEFCIFPPAPEGTACNDFFDCTHDDVCNVDGFCAGVSVCDDGNPCTDDYADEGNACACFYAPTYPGAPCSDGNACTTDDACDGADHCVAGTPTNCDDGNLCTVDSCDPATGCVSAPVVCGGADQCHEAGSCDPANGTCSSPSPLPDGTACDDGNPGTNNDSCHAGVCSGQVPCVSTNDPKSWGWYQSLCVSGGHSGDSITDADAACVAAASPTFGGFTMASQVCDVLDPSHHNNTAADKVEKQEMTLLLNICRQRICPSQETSASCGTAHTVGQTVTQVEAVLANPGHSNQELAVAECQATEINEGISLELDSLKLAREGSGIRLNWTVPTVGNDGAQARTYTIWRRVSGSGAAFVKIGSTTGVTFLDANSGTSSWDYLLKTVAN